MAKIQGMYLRGRQWWLRYTPAKGEKQLRIPLGTHIEQLAAVEALKILQEAPVNVTGEFLTALEEYIEDATRKKLLSIQGAKNRRYVLTTFADTFEVKSLSSLSQAKVEGWVDWLKGGKGGEGVARRKKPIKDATVGAYVFHLRAFCAWLVKNKRLRENVAAAVELGKVEFVARKNFLPAETVRKLIEQAPDDDMRFILYCGFHAGMRKLEIIEARPGWFRLGSGGRRGVVNLHRTATFSCKDRDERVVPLSREFEDFLHGYLGRLPADAQFVLRPRQGHGKHRYRYDFRKPFEAFMRANGIQCMTPHDMRRTFVSLKLMQDSSLIFKLAKWTGTGVEVLQNHYAHLLADDEDIETGLKPVKSKEVTEGAGG